MSSYRCLTRHPIKETWGMATWIDNYFGEHNYGVVFDMDCDFTYDPRMTRLLTKDAPNKLGIEEVAQ